MACCLRELIEQTKSSCQAAGVKEETRAAIVEILESPTVKELFLLDAAKWDSILVNDIYKVTMHCMYAKYLSAVDMGFILHIRSSPLSLAQIESQFPDVWKRLTARVDQLQLVQPFRQEVLDALKVHASWLQVPDHLVASASVAAVCTWHSGGDKSNGCRANGYSAEHQQQQPLTTFIASGPAISASNTETTIMQLTQEAIIASQVEALTGSSSPVAHGGAPTDPHHRLAPSGPGGPTNGVPNANGTAQHRSIEPQQLTRNALVASSLGHLGHVIDKLNSRPEGDNLRISIFAGRRSSDRLFLVLMNLICARTLRGYAGTSSVYVAAMLSLVWDKLCLSNEQRFEMLGPLVGTHAHEMSMALQQLCSTFDQQAQGSGQSGIPQVTPLLAHLLYWSAIGDMSAPTALADTFGTRAFIATALAAQVPESFRRHMRETHGVDLSHARVFFDLVRVWRLDSGSYEEIAECVISAWEQRHEALLQAGTPADQLPPRPQLLHSNLSSVEDVIKVAQLPTRIRPASVAFGSLADKYLPPVADHVKQASLVMKCLQAHAPPAPSKQAGAIKLGDGGGAGKVEVDPRLDAEQRHQLVDMAQHMAAVREVDSQLVSQALSDAYEAVAVKGLLQRKPATNGSA